MRETENDAIKIYKDTVKLYKYIVLTLVIAVLLLIGSMLFGNSFFKKVAIILNSNINKTESYKEYVENCIDKNIWAEEDCIKIKDLNDNYTIKGYNDMIWEKSDYDCSDFDNEYFAQTFFEYTNGVNIDWYELDENRDGVACEDLVGK